MGVSQNEFDISINRSIGCSMTQMDHELKHYIAKLNLTTTIF